MQKWYPRAHEECADLLRTAKDPRRGKPIANNTYVVRSGDADLAIRLHQTDVVTFHVNGTITLDTGGWHTVTTKDRMNTYLPGDLRVYSDRGSWFLYRHGEKLGPYFDGMTITADGEILNGVPQEEWDEFNSRSLQVRAAVKGYIDGFIAALKSEEGLPLPGGGDCWYCALRGQDGTPMGDMGDEDRHLAEHIEEDYYVPSLLLNAVTAEGYGDPRLVFAMRYIEWDRTGDEPVPVRLRLERHDHGTTRRTLRKYLLARLLPDPPVVGPREKTAPTTAHAKGLR